MPEPMNEWSDVTAAAPCEACGKPDYCTRAETAFICRRQGHSSSHGTGEPRADSNGATYWVFRAGGSDPKSFPSEPLLSPQNERADANTLHRVYSEVLKNLPWTTAVAQELARRGLSTIETLKLQQAGYRWLPSKGRSRIARAVVNVVGDLPASGTPGFVIREHEGRRYWTLSGFEGLVIPVSDSQGRIIALMTRSALVSSGKRYRYLTSKDKKSNQGSGPGSPVHVPTAKVERKLIRLTEGIIKADITTLKSGVLTIGLPGVSSWRRAAGIATELGAQTVLVAFDADWRTNPTVRASLRNLLEHLTSHDIQTILEVWAPADGKGIDDVLVSGGAIRQIEDAEEIRKLLDSADAETTQSRSSSRDDNRSLIELTPDEHVVIDQTLTALTTDQQLYKRNGQLVHVIQEPSDADEFGIHRSAGTPRILGMSAGHLRERMTERCFFFRQTEDGEKHCSPPTSIVNSVYTRGFWPQLRNLSGVTEIPVLRPDGTILTTPGWDEATGLLYVPAGELPGLLENPTREDAMQARDLLLDIVADFPFATPAHQSSWLAGLLTVLARRAFPGPAPLFLIDANIRGSGKSMLTDVVSLITTSRPMPRLSNPESDEESRKRITALALAGDPLVLIDNIASTLGSASLDAVLTGTTWKDRRLGGNEIVEIPMRAVWFATGNNVILAGDMSRRVCHVRLDSLEENPEERDNFRHPKLLAYVRENRMQLLAAGLTMLRAFFIAGKPSANLKPWGTFEGWSALIRDCLVWADMADPGGTRKELTEASDRDAAALRMLFDSWQDIDPKGEGLSAADMATLLDFEKRRRDYISGRMPISDADRLIREEREQMEAAKTALCELCGVSDVTSKDVRKIGYQLRRFKGRVMGNCRLECHPHGRSKVNKWRVINVDAGDAADAGDILPRQKNFNLTSDGNEQEINNRRRESSPAYPASPAFEDGAEFESCPNCQLPMGELCPHCG